MLLKQKTLSRDNIRNILLIQLGDIGDVLLTFPAIRSLKENFPRADVFVAVREKAKELIEECPWAAGVISVNEEKRSWMEELSYQARFFSGLRAHHFDLAIDMKAGDRAAILALLSGAKQRIGLYALDGKLWRNRVFTHLALPVQAPGRHMAEHYLSLLEEYGIQTDHVWPELVPSEARLREARDLLKKEGVPADRPVVALQPFSLWPYKEWGMKNYVGLIHWLVSRYGVSVIVTGSQDERVKADELMEECPANTYNLAGKTPIGVLPAVFRSCKLFIGVDSAGMHIAAATGIPTISLFGPSSSKDWAPRGPLHLVIHKDLPCVPCQKKGCEDSGASRCLDELTLEEVQDAVKSHMERIG
jgi:predicted lipopolysaccharide heptosyltransferase III